MTLSAKVFAGISGQITASADLQSQISSFDIRRTMSFAHGEGALQGNKFWSDRRTIAADTPDSLDLAGALADVYGTILTFAEIKAIFVRHISGTNNLIIGAGDMSPNVAFDSWVGTDADTVIVRPGGLFLLAAADVTGYAVAATTGDLLRVANAAADSPITAVSYEIAILGN